MTTVIECAFHFRRDEGRQKILNVGPDLAPTLPIGRIPRLARLMALAIRLEQLLRQGVVADYAALARLGHVTRTRITQIMNLRLLAADIQEQILFLPATLHGRHPLHLKLLQPIAREPDWHKQRLLWRTLLNAEFDKDKNFSTTS
jgi:hypothetical protein